MQCRLGEFEKARHNARIVLEASRGAGHQTGALRALTILVELDSAPGQAASDRGETWISQLDALSDATYYNADRAIALCAGDALDTTPKRRDRLMDAAAVFTTVNTAQTRQFRTCLIDQALIPDRIAPDRESAFQRAACLNEIFERLMILQPDVAAPPRPARAVPAEAPA